MLGSLYRFVWRKPPCRGHLPTSTRGAGGVYVQYGQHESERARVASLQLPLALAAAALKVSGACPSAARRRSTQPPSHEGEGEAGLKPAQDQCSEVLWPGFGPKFESRRLHLEIQGDPGPKSVMVRSLPNRPTLTPGSGTEGCQVQFWLCHITLTGKWFKMPQVPSLVSKYWTCADLRISRPFATPSPVPVPCSS